MSLDPATDFLIRKDKAALKRRLGKRETTISVIQARVDGRVGLLAATNERLLFVRKATFGSRAMHVRRDHVAGITLMGGRHTVVRVALRDGHKWSFETLHRGAGEHWLEQVQPRPKLSTQQSKQVRKDGPMEFKAKPATASTPTKPSTKMKDGYNPLDSNPTSRMERLERLKAKGQIGEAEYRWQKDALQRNDQT